MILYRAYYLKQRDKRIIQGGKRLANVTTKELK